MGNTLRSTFGTLCGGKISKEVCEEDRPVSKPKEKATPIKPPNSKKNDLKLDEDKNTEDGELSTPEYSSYHDENASEEKPKVEPQMPMELCEEDKKPVTKSKKKKTSPKPGKSKSKKNDSKLDADINTEDGEISTPVYSSYHDEHACEEKTKVEPQISQDPRYERKLLSVAEKDDKPLTLLEQSADLAKKEKSCLNDKQEFQGQDTTDNVRETLTTNTIKQDISNKTPLDTSVFPQDEHNTLDFGKYILVDPNVLDIQVIRNRSRSLDSLVSIQSNRSSISRFGSFEFVTDFEINIAEKNQLMLR